MDNLNVNNEWAEKREEVIKKLINKEKQKPKDNSVLSKQWKATHDE